MIDNLTIPSRTRPEWRDLVRGNISHHFKSFVFQIKVHKAIHDVKANNVQEAVAIEELYNLCEKYKLATHDDIVKIFNL